jgi:hypothetical protein
MGMKESFNRFASKTEGFIINERDNKHIGEISSIGG